MANKLSDFRHRVSVLKKQGLIPSSVDARSALPDSKTRGKKLSTLIAKYDAVASEKATALKVSPSKLKQFRKAGYETAGGKVIVPHSAIETAKVQGGEVVIKSRSGIERLQIPVEYQNLEQYLRDIKRNKTRIGKMKARRESIGFRFFGNNSTQLYASIDEAINDLSRYGSVVDATTKAKQKDIYKNLEFVTVPYNARWFRSERMTPSQGKRQAARMRKFRKRLKRKPKFMQDAYRDAAAERMREYRKRMKRSRTKYKQYKADAKKRAKKSRKGNKKRK